MHEIEQEKLFPKTCVTGEKDSCSWLLFVGGALEINHYFQGVDVIKIAA